MEKKTKTKPPYVRNRTIGDALTQEYTYESFVGYPANIPPYTTGTPGAPASLKTMSDRVTPQYKKLSAAGQVVFSPMTSSHYVSSGRSTGYDIVMTGPDVPVLKRGSRYIGTGNILGEALWLARGSSTLRIRADTYHHLYPVMGGISEPDIRAVTNEASSKAHAIPSDAQLLVAMAEAKQTLMLLPNIYKELTHLLSGINSRYASYLARQSSRRPSGNALKDAINNLISEARFLNDLWLAIRFGLRPLISDVTGVMSALGKDELRGKTRATSRGQVNLERSSSSTGELSFGCLRLPTTEMTTDSVTVRAMKLWEARISMLDNLGVNVANLPLAAVDLTAFSFVLNWVLTLNEFASALGATVQPGWASLGECVVTRRETTTIYSTAGSYIAPGFPDYTLTSGPEGFMVLTNRSINRTPVLQTPRLALRGDPLKWTRDLRLIDAAALLMQQARGKGVRRLAQLVPTTIPGISVPTFSSI